ncbi:MAG TPA: hypothetical protein PLP17_14585, partial [Oligoflexia bacterium]|nr:hypothetical protein [Oligoflexia bacterium]
MGFALELQRVLSKRIIAVISATFLTVNPASSQDTDEPLGKAEALAKRHIDKVLNELPGYENYGKDVAERGVEDAVAGN